MVADHDADAGEVTARGGGHPGMFPDGCAEGFVDGIADAAQIPHSIKYSNIALSQWLLSAVPALVREWVMEQLYPSYLVGGDSDQQQRPWCLVSAEVARGGGHLWEIYESVHGMMSNSLHVIIPAGDHSDEGVMAAGGGGYLRACRANCSEGFVDGISDTAHTKLNGVMSQL